jgi:hypothetical protein
MHANQFKKESRSCENRNKMKIESLKNMVSEKTQKKAETR